MSRYVKIYTFFFQQGFIKSKINLNLYIKKDENENVYFISLYVDDLLVTWTATKLMNEKGHFSQEFGKKDLSHLHYCSSTWVWRKDGKTLITQSKYTKKLFRKFNVMKCKLENNVKLCNDEDTKEANGTLYRQLVGILNYLTTITLGIIYSLIIHS